MKTHSRTVRAALAALSVASWAALSGCGAERGAAPPTAPATSGAGSALGFDEPGFAAGGRLRFYPLGVGSEWRYRTLVRLQFQDLLDPAHSQTVDLPGAMSARLVGREDLFGRSYVVEERQTTQEQEPGVIFNWVRYREDGAGLYEADVPLTQPPGDLHRPAAATPASAVSAPPRCPLPAAQRRPEVEEAWRRLAARLARIHRLLGLPVSLPGAPSERPSPRRQRDSGGVLPGEITRLHYPLHVGDSWIVRDDDGLTASARVERNEVLRLAPGRLVSARIRLDNPLLGPRDLVRMWYSRRGFLQLGLHAEMDVTDAQGQLIGRLLADERQELTALAIAPS